MGNYPHKLGGGEELLKQDWKPTCNNNKKFARFN